MNKKVNIYSRYLNATALASLVLLVIYLLFIYLIDPVGIFNTPVVAGVNNYKAGHLDYEYAYKTASLKNQTPSCIVIGSSKVGHGIDISNGNWACYEGGKFNVGLGQADLNLINAYINTANSTKHLKKIILALDFSWFVKPMPKREIVIGNFAPYSDFNEIINLGFSPKMLSLAFSSLFRSMLFESPLRDDIGRIKALHYERKIISYRGYRSMFINEMQTYKSYRSKNKTISEMKHELEVRMDFLEKMVTALEEAGINLYIFTTPSHAWELEAIDNMGLQNLHELWKIKLANMVRTSKNTKILDFDTYSQYSTAPVPQYEDIPNPWFWESTHFKENLGGVVLDILLDRRKSLDPLFGIELTPETVKSHILLNREAQSRYREQHYQELLNFNALSTIFMEN